jgi:hypothetical protein
VYFRVSPMKGVKRFEIRGKLALHYIGLFSHYEEIWSRDLQVVPTITLGRDSQCVPHLTTQEMPKSTNKHHLR